MVRTLADLSDYELAPLFNMTVPEVQHFRNPPKNIFDDVMPDQMKAEEATYRAWLWNLPVEEFKRLRDEGAPEIDRFSQWKIPVDVVGRFRVLRDLLQRQREFETRYPAAYEILLPHVTRRRELLGLFLPSFDVRILNNWIHPHVRIPRTSFEGADAHTSVSSWWQKDWRLPEANRDIGALPFDDLQGVLLAILSREESGERIDSDSLGPGHQSGIVEGVRGPEESYIRLTDLRLADSLPPNAIKQGMKPLLDLLHRPVSTEHVVLWKLRLLGSESEHHPRTSAVFARHVLKIPAHEVPDELAGYIAGVREYEAQRDENHIEQKVSRPISMRSDLLIEQFGSKETGIAAVSFTAAALWLFLDLDMRDVKNASTYRLAEQVESLASIIGGLTRRLRRSTEDLGKLVANRPSGNHPEIPGNNLLALQRYRMGYSDLRHVAEWLGITPYSSRTGRGTRDWKARAKQRLREGIEFEKKFYPRAAAIFAHRDHPAVRRKARRAYRGFLIENGRRGVCRFHALGFWARTNAADTKRGREIAWAYCQLGSCIIQRIPTVL